MNDAPVADAWIGRRLGPYRVVALIGIGGMGRVYRAARDDGHYERDVAIKLLRDEDADAAGSLLARFDAERRILATLDHPNIARLLDAGIADDGTPYFVMEHVAGEPIDRHAEQAGLDLPSRLRLFRKVCDAVEYTHQQGVLHRDLKPANLLVTADGIVKLVDFGIARRAGQAGAATRRMTALYASPEQLQGFALSPASDLYALGVVLHRLLTGALPYARTGGPALVRAICEEEPIAASRAAPATRRRQLHGDLDAVVALALRKDPAQRYASARALSEDLFRHLEGLPVQARRGAWSYRAGRFLLRHRSIVGAGLVANLVLLAAIALVAYQAHQAHLQRERAERHFASVRQLARVLTFDVHDMIQNLPGATQARKQVVEHSLAYLRQLAADASADRQLRVETAVGYRKVGDIQGRPFGPNLGDPRGAAASYAQAQALLEPVSAGADGVPARRELIVVHKRQGALADSTGELDKADAALRRGIAMAQALVDADPKRTEDQALLAGLHGQMSQLKFYAGDMAGYRQASELEFRWLEAVVQRRPDDHEAWLTLADSHDLRGQYLAQRNDSEAARREALAAFERSLAIKLRLHRRDPDNTSLTRSLAGEHLNLGVTLLGLREAAQAVGHYRQATTLLAALAERDPGDMDARKAQALASNNLSGALYEQGDVAGSADAARAAIALFASLPEGAREDVAALRIQGRSHYHLGRALQARGQRPAACTHYAEGLAILERVQRRVGLAPNQLHPDTLRQALRGCPSR